MTLKRVATIEAANAGEAERLAELFFELERDEEDEKAEELPMGLTSGRARGTATAYEYDLIAEAAAE